MSAGNEKEFIDFQQSKEKGGRSMKCPMHYKVVGYRENTQLVELFDCVKEECAWWVDGEEGCLLTFIEKDLAGIWTLLTTIANKMPHEEQFRR